MINWEKLIRLGLAVVIVLLLFKIFLAIASGTPGGFYAEQGLNGLYLIILGGFIIYNFLGSGQKSKLIAKFIIWLGIFLIPIIGYAFRFELSELKERVIAAILPSYAQVKDNGEMVISRSNDNHFYLIAYSDGVKIKFLVDTGASDIALSRKDAIALGFNLAKLKYTRTYSTANGTSSGAPVKIKRLTIGNRTFLDLDAHVVSGELDTSLFGMSAIGRFKSFKITKDSLILY